jgi:hypothetical protein
VSTVVEDVPKEVFVFRVNHESPMNKAHPVDVPPAITI